MQPAASGIVTKFSLAFFKSSQKMVNRKKYAQKGELQL